MKTSLLKSFSFKGPSKLVVINSIDDDQREKGTETLQVCLGTSGQKLVIGDLTFILVR